MYYKTNMTTIIDIQKRIATASSEQNFEEAARLSQIAAEIKKLDEQKNHLLEAVIGNNVLQPRNAIPPAGNGLHMQFPHGISRSSSRGGLSVEMTTKGGSPVRVCERTSAETLVVLMERILANFGLAGLEKLMHLHVSRGPLVSRDPRRDFVNHKTGQLYAHHRISGTDLYVLTHSDNKQKVENVIAALRLLGLPEGSFRVNFS